jgi:FkbM family methyltransferase
MSNFIPTAARLFDRLPRALRRHKLMRAWMRLTGEDPYQLVRIRDQSFGYVDMRDGFMRLIVIDGDYETDFFAVADALLCDGGVFVDVGANFGLFSFGLAGRHGAAVRYHLFEPNLTLVMWINRTLSRYPTANFKVNSVAVSDKDGFASLLFSESQSGISHITQAGGVQVRSVTLDNYLDEQNLSRVNLVKVDIEGYELLAIRGAMRSLQSRRIQAVYFEYFEHLLTRAGSASALLQEFDALGYEVCFCRAGDLASQGGKSHTIRKNMPGRGLALRPVKNCRIPPMTDLLAVPKENLIDIQ